MSILIWNGNLIDMEKNVNDALERTRLNSTIHVLQAEVEYLSLERTRLLEDVERYRKETERLQNLWYDALQYQMFPPVKVETIKLG